MRAMSLVAESNVVHAPLFDTQRFCSSFACSVDIPILLRLEIVKRYLLFSFQFTLLFE
jgi:hypothetical protein